MLLIGLSRIHTLGMKKVKTAWHSLQVKQPIENNIQGSKYKKYKIVLSRCKT